MRVLLCVPPQAGIWKACSPVMSLFPSLPFLPSYTHLRHLAFTSLCFLNHLLLIHLPSTFSNSLTALACSHLLSYSLCSYRFISLILFCHFMELEAEKKFVSLFHVSNAHFYKAIQARRQFGYYLSNPVLIFFFFFCNRIYLFWGTILYVEI